MALKTQEEYKESLRRLRPNVHKFGELIKDVTAHPATKWTVEGHAQIFAAALSPEYEALLAKTSSITGERVSRYLSIMESSQDFIYNCQLKRLMFNLTGTCTGGRCGGWSAINAAWITTYDMDQTLGTDYQQRLREWLIQAQANDIAISAAMTDPKGNRSLLPHQQIDPDMNLRIVDIQNDGVVVRGAKIMICGTAAANEVFVLPGRNYGEPDKDYAVSFVIPKDTKGITIVETRHPSDMREFEQGFDTPVKKGGITQAYIFFEDVFVPKECLLTVHF